MEDRTTIEERSRQEERKSATAELLTSAGFVTITHENSPFRLRE